MNRISATLSERLLGLIEFFLLLDNPILPEDTKISPHVAKRIRLNRKRRVAKSRRTKAKIKY